MSATANSLADRTEAAIRSLEDATAEECGCPTCKQRRSDATLLRDLLTALGEADAVIAYDECHDTKAWTMMRPYAKDRREGHLETAYRLREEALSRHRSRMEAMHAL